MLDLTLQIVLWGSITLLLHTLVLYPLSLRLLPRKYDLDPPEQPDNELPSVALLIAAYNESLVIARKIGNSFAQDYPQEKLEIIVGSDGSTDGTDEIVKSFVDPRLRLVRLDGRNGKPLGPESPCRGNSGRIS
ncbi:MAG: glycosyltransferase [bacterium]|nr:glycosyltransferase [bacterium]